MKRNLYTIAFALIATFSAHASSFYLHFSQPGSYQVNIDGNSYRVNGTNLRVPGLQHGRHYLTVESFAPARGNYHRPMPVRIFRGPLMIRDYSDVFASIDGRGFHIDRVIPHRQYRGNGRQDYHYRYNNYNNQYYEFNDDYRNDRDNSKSNGGNNRAENDEEYYDDRNNNNSNDENGYTDDYRNDEDHYDWNRNGNNTANRYMNSRDFDALKQSVNNASFESTKRTVAMSGIAQNSMSVEQLKELIMLFSFESTKLEIAKYAYNYTPDKRKYYLLTDAFSFDSSKNEIAKLNGTR